MFDFDMRSRRAGKMLASVMWSKEMQKRGKKVIWATPDQAATAEKLSKHGALCELVGTDYVRPHFKKGE